MERTNFYITENVQYFGESDKVCLLAIPIISIPILCDFISEATKKNTSPCERSGEISKSTVLSVYR